MGQDIIQAQYTTLEAIARRFAEQAEAQTTLSRAVADRMAPLQQGSWIGRGADAFAGEMHGAVMPSLQRLAVALQRAAEVTSQIHDQMRDAEADAARLFQVTGAVVGAIAAQEAGAGLAGGNGAGAHTGGSPSTPPPRIFIVNGINSTGNVFARDRNGHLFFGDDQSVALKQLLERNGFDPSQVETTPAVYLQPQPTKLTGTALTGTQLGGWLAPADWLSSKGAAGINSVTAFGASLVNGVTRSLLSNNTVRDLAGTVTGVYQTAREYRGGETGTETQKTYANIQQKLAERPLLPGQSIVLVGHSGGGAIVTNLAGMIERGPGGHDVRGVVTAGSPLANYSEASRYAEYVVEVKHSEDWVRHAGVPLLAVERISAATRSNVVGIELNTSVSGTLDAHGSYMYSNQMAKTLRMLFPGGSRFNPI